MFDISTLSPSHKHTSMVSIKYMPCCVFHSEAMEYYSAKKKKELLLLETAWMKSEDIILNEMSQPASQPNIILYHLFVELKKNELIETE